MTSTLRLTLLVICALLLFKSPSSAGSDSKMGMQNSSNTAAPYTFAVIPFYTPEKIWSLYTPFVRYLEKATGDKWELKLYHNHDELIDNLCNGKISLALLGPVPLGRANSKCGVRPLLVALGKSGTPEYSSVILTNNPAVGRLTDLKGKKIGFFKGSTAAHIIPAAMIKESGIATDSIKPVFLESQDRIMAALLSGEIDAAGVKDALAERFSNVGLKMIARSQPLPNFALCAASTLNLPAEKRLLSSLLRLKPSENQQDALITTTWDDEIRFGFTTPDSRFLPSVMRVFKIFRDISR